MTDLPFTGSGLFSPRQGRGGPRKGYVPKNRRSRHATAWSPARDAILMEHVSRGLVFGDVARAMGMTRNQVISRFHRLRDEMGWQAQ